PHCRPHHGVKGRPPGRVRHPRGAPRGRRRVCPDVPHAGPVVRGRAANPHAAKQCRTGPIPHAGRCRGMSTDRKRRVPLRYLPQLLASVIRSSPFVALGLLAITLVSSVIPALQLTKVGEITATIEELGRGQAEAADGIGWSLVLTPLVLLVGLILLDTLLS